MKPGPNDSLADAKAWLESRMKEGVFCPCCEQYARIWDRSITSGMAQALVSMYRKAGTGWFNMPKIRDWRSRDEAMLKYWGIIRNDPSRRGWWCVTDLGERFLKGDLKLQQYARVYNKECLYLHGKDVDFQSCLGTPFSLEELKAR